jgi:hypothetical protein
MLYMFEFLVPMFAGAMLVASLVRTVMAKRAKYAFRLSLEQEKPEELRHLRTLAEILKDSPERLDARDILHIQEILHQKVEALEPRDREYVKKTLHQTSLQGRAAYAASVLMDASAEKLERSRAAL